MARTGAHRAGGSARRGLILLLVFLVALPAAAFGVYRYAMGGSGPSRPVVVEVPEGATVARTGEILEDAEVVRSALAFRIAAGVRGIAESLQAGEYELRTNMPVGDVLDVLERGPVPPETLTLTVPEGLELEEIARTVAEQLGVDAEAFEAAASSGDYVLPPYLPEDAPSVEGFLFPKTYEFPTEVDEDDVITRLLAQFEDEVSTLDWSRAEALGLTPYEVVIVASMIEREARVARDRAKVSAVIHNRLAEGMPLQIDATVQYAIPEDNRPLTFADYEFESPYNTYLHAGLPPTPIASPGLASLEAALAPADEAYLYFVVTDPETGEHAFAETYEEFLRLKEEAGL